MVKALHPLGPLSSRIELSTASRVKLAREESAGGNGSDRSVRSESTVSPMSDADVAGAVRAALEAPLEFPPFAKVTVPGDRLAIAIDEAVPQPWNVLRGAIEVAVAVGIEATATTVVTSDQELADTLREKLAASAGLAVAIEVHDAEDPNELCPVGQTQRGDWLRINRTLFDADVVLPIGCARLAGGNGNGMASVFESLFPRFCDAETIAQWRTPSQRVSSDSQQDLRQRTEEAGWLLGVPLVMQVIPGGDGTVADVVAGEPTAVAARGHELCRKLWAYQVDQRASLVIATITGGHIEQRWSNVARALEVAEQVADVGAAVAVCTDMDAPPSQSLTRLLSDGDWEKAERRAAENDSVDGWTAWQLARALERGPVYLLSQLEAEVVEDLGLAPVADLAELGRLAERHESCVVIDDSQHAVATVAGES